MSEKSMLDTLLQRLEDLRGQDDSSAIIAHIEYMLSLISVEDLPLRWSSLQRELGDVLQEAAQEQGQIQRALHCYDQALTIYMYQDTLDDWAMTLHHKGLALRKLSTYVVEKQESGILQQALSCYDQALTVYTYQTTPAEWANVLYHRGFALHRLAVFQSGKEQEDTFREILRGYDGVLRVSTSASHPNEWATAQNNKGIAL
jgi:tetratricopeptide (TPR) repeat protein